MAEIDVNLFNNLTSLETLDISQNCLTNIPDTLRLPKLRVLDCSDNQIKCVKFVKAFKKLQELYVEDNDQILVSKNLVLKPL